MRRSWVVGSWVVAAWVFGSGANPGIASASLLSWDRSSPTFQVMVRAARSALQEAKKDAKAKKPKSPEPENDESIGRNEHARLLKAGLKLSQDPEKLSRVEKIGRSLEAAIRTLDLEPLFGKRSTEGFPFRFFVVEDESINAFALPGGYIYVHTGLLSFVRSDGELAGVMGHELIHSWHRHGFVLNAQVERIASVSQWGTLGAMLGSALAGLPLDVALAAYYGGPLLGQAKISELSQRAENDADHGSVPLLKAAGIDPVGTLTMLEKLAMEASRRGFPEYGVYQSHPDERDRVLRVQSQLVKLGFPIRRRSTNGLLPVDVLARLEKGCLELQVSGHPILCSDPGRVARFAEGLDVAMDLALAIALVRVEGSVLLIDAGEKLPLGLELESSEIALQARDALRRVLWRAEFEKADVLYSKGQRQGSAI